MQRQNQERYSLWLKLINLQLHIPSFLDTIKRHDSIGQHHDKPGSEYDSDENELWEELDDLNQSLIGKGDIKFQPNLKMTGTFPASSDQFNLFRHEINKMQTDFDDVTLKLRNEKMEKTRLESRIKKIQLSTEIEKRNFLAITKIKAKEKEGKRLLEMDKRMNKEIQYLIENYNEQRLSLFKKDMFIKKLIKLILS